MSGLKKSQHLRLSFKDIEVATSNFETSIGKGGFGQVYKGQLSISGILTTVAVKRLNVRFGQGLKEFLMEIDMLTGQRHPNLISLLGYCDEGCEKIIVYEYAERRSLDRYIRHSTLTWLERLKICIDVACGLDHLHNHIGKHQAIIHRDIKSGNILLDENWVAKISDFGLSRLSLSGLGRSPVISQPCGTRGYCEPEYINSSIVTKKSDVYSFGMVLFEVLCGKLCYIADKDGVLLSAELAKECYENKKLHDIINPSLRKQMSSKSMSTFSAIAYRCLHDDREQRPTMDVVKKELEETLKLQVSNTNSIMDTQTLAVQLIPDPPALQVDELKIARTKMLCDDIVIIKQAEKEDEATVITINCPDKTGLVCDICHSILFFGLSIVRGDVSTDGKWCYIVLWVTGNTGIIWSLLKKRLLEACPAVYSVNALVHYPSESESPKPADVYLLKFCCYDRQGRLHDFACLLRELELVIQRMKVSTTPDGRMMDLFLVTDTRGLLRTAKTKELLRDHFTAILKDAIISYDIEMFGCHIAAWSYSPSSFLPPAITAITEDMLESNCRNSVLVAVDNSFSPSHTLVQINCHDRKGLLYDTTRTLKDYNIQISYGQFKRKEDNLCEIELFIVQADGKKIVDPSKQTELTSRIRMEIVGSLRVVLVNRGPDMELLVANPVELCGKGRPLVFYDITRALKILNIDIFSAEVNRHVIGGRVWEVYRVLLDEGDKLSWQKGRIEEAVRNVLMGWDRSR